MWAKLIFFKQHSKLATKIKKLDGGDYSHVAVCISDDLILEATPPNTRIVSLKVRLRESYASKIMYLPIEKPAKIYHTLGKPYDWGWSHGQTASPPDRLHCATLIGYLFDLKGPRHPDLSLSELYSFCKEGK